MVPTTREWRTTACRRQPFCPTDGGADAHFENTRGTTARGALPNSMDHALTQVRRIGGWHEVLLALSPGTLANRADSRKVVMMGARPSLTPSARFAHRRRDTPSQQRDWMVPHRIFD